VPRPLRSIDPNGPLAEFASGLRTLREGKHLTLRQLSQRTSYGRSVLSEAASGTAFPSWDVTEAYVQACGGSADEWRPRWEEAKRRWDEVRRTRQPAMERDRGFYDEIGHRGGTERSRSAAAGPAAGPTAFRSIADDPTQINTFAELARALNDLRRAHALTFAALERRAQVLSERVGRSQALPKSTVSDMLTGKSVPTKERLITFLTVCGIADQDVGQWRAAWDRAATAYTRDRAATAYQGSPRGATRVRDARPRALGIHAAIQFAGAPGELPVYVPRDLDADLRAAITVAVDQGGFVLLVGGSSVGKSRALYEAVAAILPDWWLIHPIGADDIRAHAAASIPRTVLWLDELQNYLDGDFRLAGAIRALLQVGTVVVGALWPHEYTSRVRRPQPGHDDRYVADREILALAEVINVPDTLTATERHRAEVLAEADPRIRVALNGQDFGFIQTLAAGPELIRWWEHTADPYGKALLTTALDIYRLGVRTPLTRKLLASATPGYLTPVQRATAPPDWLDHALAYASSPLHGAVSALMPVARTLGVISGYRVADYLAQHAERARQDVLLPDTTWHALRDHLTESADLVLAGRAAEERLLFRHAEALYAAAMNAGASDAALHLADLMQMQGRTEEAVIVLSQLESDEASIRTARVLVAAGRVDELRARVDAGDRYATAQLVELLTSQGRVDEAIAILRERTTGDWYTAAQLVNLLADQGRVDEAIAVQRQRTAAGDRHATVRLAELLAQQGHVDEAIWLLRERVDVGDEHAVGQLADLLVDQGDVEELRSLTDAGHPSAAARLARVLTERGEVEELRARADAGDAWAAERLAKLLIQQSHVDEATELLRPLADAGHAPAAARLARLLTERGKVDELRTRAKTGDPWAAVGLAETFTEHGTPAAMEQEGEALYEFAALGPWATHRLAYVLNTRRQRTSERLSPTASPLGASGRPT
jgi:transcriptional regulator with XRE-family HTH domain/tetratricopeptide (TPR) repeat protein